MTPRPAAKSLSGKIFSSLLVFTLGIIVAFAMVMTTIYFASYEKDAEGELASSARDAATYLNAVPASAQSSALEAQFSGSVRYTLVASDGTVLYDSVADPSQMENHASRPEIQQAEDAGDAVTVRYSATLGTDTVYAAVKLDDGSLVRLSETRHSLIAFLGDMAAPVVVALVVAGVLVFVLSRTLTKRIMKPIDALNFADPLQNEIYEEMDPLLVRIDEQQRTLLEQNRELARAESMRRDFSSNVSHEMKTPLQVISGYAELMKNDMVDPADRRAFAGLIYDEAQAMRSLINDVLTLSRLDESAFGDENDVLVDVKAVADRVAGRLSSFASERCVDVRIAGLSGLISGNETLVEEMVYNLVENGIRYNHPGGAVTCTVFVERATFMPDSEDEPLPEGEELARLDEREWSAPRDTVVVRVRDTGPGIPDGYQDKVFERFFRIDKSRSKETGGTGLGLAIVKHAVVYHHGNIEVENSPGGGTLFTLRFPAAE